MKCNNCPIVENCYGGIFCEAAKNKKNHEIIKRRHEYPAPGIRVKAFWEDNFKKYNKPNFSYSSDGRLRIGIIVPCLHNGGAETWTRSLIEYTDFKKIDWRGIVVAGEDDHLITPNVLPQFLKYCGGIGYGRADAQLLADNCDIIITWWIQYLPSLINKKENKPLIISVCHAPGESQQGIIHYSNPEGIDHFVAISESALYPIPDQFKNDTPIIENCINLNKLKITRSSQKLKEELNIPIDKKIAGYIGRLSQEKGCQYLPDIAKYLPDDWIILVVGDGPIAKEYKNINCNKFYHRSSDPLAGDIINIFDVVLSLSEYESFGLSIAESLWMKKPLVSTEVGILKNKNTLYTNIPHNFTSENVVIAILKAYNDGYNENAYKYIENNFLPSVFTKKWNDYLLQYKKDNNMSLVNWNYRGGMSGIQGVDKYQIPEDIYNEAMVRQSRCQHKSKAVCGTCSGVVSCALGKGFYRRVQGQATPQDCLDCKIEEVQKEKQL